MAGRVGVNLRASVYLDQGDRKYMEDVSQVAYQKSRDKNDIEYAFFGIFDGHGGKEAANFAKDLLMDVIVNMKLFWSDDDLDVLAAIKEGFIQTHMLMLKYVENWPKTASGWPSTSGTTSSVAFIKRQKIFIGHVGDSGIVLGYEDANGEWQAQPLTNDHKPDSPLEKKRIIQCGGKVINKAGVPRVVWSRPRSGHQGPVRRSTSMDEIPFLAVARSLGDLWSFNPNNKQFIVSPVPDLYCIPIDIKKYRCLIFGTDGLWNVLSPASAVNIADSVEKNNEKYYIDAPSENGKPRLWLNPSRSMVNLALECYKRAHVKADNTSAVTVYLDPPGKCKREVLLSAAKKAKTTEEPEKAKAKSNEKVNPIETTESLTKNWLAEKNDGKEENGYGDRIYDLIKDDNHDNCNSPRIPFQNCTRCGNSLENNDENKEDPDMSIVKDKENPKIKDIQSPIVSSSTASPVPFIKNKNSNSKDENAKTEDPPPKDCVRKTRSGRFKEDKEQKPLVPNNRNCKTNVKPSTSKVSKPNDSTHMADPISRVLKSVNRSHSLGGNEDLNKSICTKRKRLSDSGANVPVKSIRIETRSHTWTNKRMITRSQEKSHKLVRLK